MRRRLFGLVVLLLLIGGLALASKICLVRTESATIIVPDDFLTIQEAINNAIAGDTVFVRAGTYYEHVVVNKTVSLVGEDKDRTVVDGNGTGRVIDIVSDNANVTGFTVQRGGSIMFPDFDAGISMNSTRGCKISSNNIVDNGCFGVHLLDSDQNAISGNSFTRNTMYAIDLTTSSNNIVSFNTAIFNANIGIGMHVSSQNNIILGNTMINNTCGIDAARVSDNTISGNYIANNSDIGIWIQDYAINNTICGNILTNGQSGIQILNSGLTEICNNTIAHNYGSDWDAGIRLDSADNSKIHSNLIIDNWRGILLYTTSPYVSIYNNNITDNEYAIRVASGGSNYLNVSDNIVMNNRGYGVGLTGFGGASDYATITRNLIVNNSDGIALGQYSNYHNILQNNISQNGYGFYVEYSTQNTIWGNNIVDNDHQVYLSTGPVNNWDGGYPAGGNYWSDYDGNDTFYGPNQDSSGSDGKGDTPYVIDEDNQDSYPLMDPYRGSDVTPPQFANRTQNPPEEEIQPDASVTVTIDVIDESGVESVTLLYKNNSTGLWSGWIEIAMNHTKDNTYEAIIPPFQYLTAVEYCINGTDFFDNWCVTPDEGYSYTYHVISEFSPPMVLVMLTLAAFAATTLKRSARS